MLSLQSSSICIVPLKVRYDSRKIEVGHYVENVLSLYHELMREKQSHYI